eukprot:Skav202803  [mRNA]  locus=scaffold326:882725:884593:- [translate_table: standard]
MERSFSLVDIPSAHLNAYLWDAWDGVLSSKVRDRKGLEQWPDMDTLATRSVDLPTDKRTCANLANLRCLGTMWADQRSKWCEEHGESSELLKCPLCGGSDTREHFPYECAGTEQLRAEFEAVIQEAKTHSPHMCFLPVIYKHPQCKIVQLANFQRTLPEPFVPLPVDNHDGGRLIFFTDGSCIFPEQGGRMSSWSVIQDCCGDDDRRILLARMFRLNGTTPTTLVPVQVGMTTGPQTINRAELTAMIQIVSSSDEADIYSDSQWAIDAFSAVQRCPVRQQHVGMANDDLLLQLVDLAVNKSLDRFRLFKIAAHQTLTDISSDLELYRALGNHEADRVAKKGVQRDISPMHALGWDIGEWYQRQIRILTELGPFLARAEMLRLDAFDKLTKEHEESVKGKLFSMQKALQWNPDASPLVGTLHIPDRVLETFMPGPSLLRVIVDFLMSLRWPSEETYSVGCSWFEIAVNFFGVTGIEPPRIANRGSQILHYKDPAKEPEAALLPLQVWDVVRILETAASHIRRFMGVNLVPYQFAKTRWHLGFAGYKNKLAGFSVRPVFHCVDLHLEMLQSLVTTGGLGIPRGFTTDMLFTRVDNVLDELGFDVRRKKLKCLQQYVSKYGVLVN